VLENAIVRYATTGQAPAPMGTRHPSATPFQAFPTADGYVVIALAFGAEDQWVLLCGLLGATELIGDERFATGPRRTQRHAELEPILNRHFSQRTTQEWLDELLAAGIPCGPLNSVPQIMADPQIAARGMIQPVTHPTAGTLPIANSPVRMSRSESGIKGPPPDMGQDTETVLGELLGLSADAVRDLAARGVVATSGGPDISQIT
jgi:CoA:oxalate CoA-transferase